MNAIRTEGLTKYYGKTRGVEGLDLTVEQGDFFGFIGPNGAGKSTAIRLLLGLIRPSGGRGSVLGLDIGRDREKILRRVGYLPAESAFWPGMRVRNVLALSASLRGQDCRKQADALCQRLRLDTSRKVEQLSLGGKKKTAIVCALQHEPELLILDEPTSGLDPLMQREFFAILRERNAQGASIFLSSHILPEIQHNCSRAAIIRQGTVIACGSMEQLVRAGPRRVALQGRAELAALEGVQALHQTPEGAEFLYSGDMRALLSALAAGDVRDLSVAEPDLERAFWDRYRQEGEKNDDRQA